MRKELPWTGERIVTSIYWELAAEHLSRYAFALEFCKGKKVLDAACGEGYGTAILSEVAAHVTGVDIDRETIEFAGRKYQKENIAFTMSDVCTLPFSDRSFDVVVSFETLEHVDDHQRLLNEFRRVLAPGGLLFVSTPDKQYYTVEKDYHNPFHKKELFSHEFEALLNANFANVEIFCQQNFFGNIIYPKNGNDNVAVGASKKYEGSFSAVQPDESMSKALYMIGVASDDALPALDTVFFQDKKIVENLYKNSSSKLGNAVMRPLSRLKTLFKKG